MLNFLKKLAHRGEDHDAPENIEATQLETYALWVVFGMLFLLPIIFLPSITLPFQFTKTLIVFFGVLIALVLFVVSRLREGSIYVPFQEVLLAVWALPAVYFVSALLSSSTGLSFFGNNYEVDTFSYLLLMAVLVSLVVALLRKREQTLYAYMTLFAAFFVVWLFQGARLLFGPEFLSFDVLTLATSNILGKWNDLAIFFGLATVMTLVTLASLQLSSMFRRVFYGMLVVSLFFLAVVNFNVVWIMVGLFALGFFIHSIGIARFNWQIKRVDINEEAGEHEEEKKATTLSVPALLVLLVSVVFIFAGDNLGNTVAARFGISQIEARPSWQTTVDIGRATLAESPLFGSGPNTFVKQWTAHKPQAINNTIFWNADFIAGIGTVPTAFITTGLIGALAWLLFLGLFVYGGVRALVLAPVGNQFSYFLTLSSFLGGLYLWIMTVLYTPNVVLMTLAFFFTGVFIASLRHHPRKFYERYFSFANNPKTGFVSVLSLTIVLLLAIIGMYGVGKDYRAAHSFQEGIIAFNVEGDIDRAEQLVTRATELNTSDRYHRFLSDIYIGRINILTGRTDLNENELRDQFQQYLANAIQHGQQATAIDGENYQNWLARGRVYQAVVPLGIEGAYENAVTSLDEALRLNPRGAAILLTRARLEAARGDNAAARDYIARALQEKNDYTEAIFLLSQIEIQDGNLDRALESVEAAAFVAPNNPVVFFQLGLLRYNQGDYQGAVADFSRATQLNNVYSNAMYFLGLSYEKLDQTPAAILEFEKVEALNPDNEEVKLILENLRSGNDPFDSATGAAATPPENRPTLPIDEGAPVDSEPIAEVEDLTLEEDFGEEGEEEDPTEETTAEIVEPDTDEAVTEEEVTTP